MTVYLSKEHMITEQERHRETVYKRPESLHTRISAFMPRDITQFALQAPMRDARAIAAVAAKSRLNKEAPPPEVEMRKCRSCRVEKPVTEYNKHGKSADGSVRRDLDCRTCHNARYPK
jgi:heterodisulfide reductase subunit A-like polyferredoxin